MKTIIRHGTGFFHGRASRFPRDSVTPGHDTVTGRSLLDSGRFLSTILTGRVKELCP
jgi:hypothetical protein